VASHMPALLAAADMVVTMQGGRIEAVRLQPEAAAERRRAAPAAAAADAAVLAAGAAAGAACWSDSCAVAAGGSVAAGMALTGAGKALPEVENRTSDEEEGQGEERGGGVQQERGQEEERQLGHVRWSVYRQYAGATGWAWVAVILSSLLLMQAGAACHVAAAACVNHRHQACHHAWLSSLALEKLSLRLCLAALRSTASPAYRCCCSHAAIIQLLSPVDCRLP
jgi:hypothetical protein